MTENELKRSLVAFYKYLIVDHAVARTTAEGYCRSLSPVLKSLNTQRPTHAAYRKYLFWMHAQKYSYNHILNTTLAIEAYTKHKRYALRIGRAKKPKRMIPQTLTEAEVSRLIQCAPDIRQQALIALLAFSGMRNLELCHVKVGQLDPAMNHIKVTGGKGDKDRLVNISPECTKLLLLYLTAFPRSSEALLFTTLRHNAPLQTGDVRKIVRTVARSANINRRVYPHLFRHSLATNLLARGASLLTIREQLGHAFIESTMIYSHPMPARVRAEYDFFKPAYL